MDKILTSDTFINKIFWRNLKALEVEIDKTINSIVEKIENFLNNFTRIIEDLNSNFELQQKNYILAQKLIIYNNYIKHGEGSGNISCLIVYLLIIATGWFNVSKKNPNVFSLPLYLQFMPIYLNQITKLKLLITYSFQ